MTVEKGLFCAAVIFMSSFIVAEILADQPTSRTKFTSETGQYEFVYIQGSSWEQQWALRDSTSHSIRYYIQGSFSTKAVVVSDDGTGLIALDYACFDNPDNNPILVTFYKSGHVSKQYRFSDLLHDLCSVDYSGNSFSWMFDGYNLTVSQQVLCIQTFELHNLSFDIQTGELLNDELDPSVVDGLYVYGSVQRINADECAMKVVYSLHGDTAPGSLLIFKRGVLSTDIRLSMRSLVIRNGECIAVKNVVFNGCQFD